jgi:hypothetical protein
MTPVNKKKPAAESNWLHAFHLQIRGDDADGEKRNVQLNTRFNINT